MTNYYRDEVEITEPWGNNAIAYAERMALSSRGKLTVPRLIDGMITDITLGDQIVFEEVENGKLLSCTGLQNLLKISHNNQTIYITDNHHHALYFWYQALTDGLITKGATLLHIDQHADMNEPAERIDTTREHDMDYMARYVNEQTQIASFIQPALRSGLVTECVQIRTETKLAEIVETYASANEQYILDIDLDFFAAESDVTSKRELIRQLVPRASLITIATSPSFFDQKRALELIDQLLK